MVITVPAYATRRTGACSSSRMVASSPASVTGPRPGSAGFLVSDHPASGHTRFSPLAQLKPVST